MKFKSLLVVTGLSFSAAAGAQDTLLEYVTESCQADMDKYCSQVTPGEGRLLYCAAAHQDKLSAECEGALVNAAMIMNDLTDRVLYVAEACETELMTHCADVEVGGGQVLACLDEHDSELGETCDEALDELLDD